MGRVLLVACTSVGRQLILAMKQNKKVSAELVGIVNLSFEQSLGKANYDSYADLIKEFQIPIYYCDNVNEEGCKEFIKFLQPDVIIQTGWSQKFDNELLHLPTYGCIGQHAAPLPKGRGAACINWAILTGEKEWGDTFFRMVEKYDEGEIFAQKFFRIEEYDTVYTIYEKVAECASKTMIENIDCWSEGIFEAIQQDETKATHYGRRRPTDGEIKTWDIPAKTLHDFIRAQTDPYPGAYIMYDSKKITFLSSKVHSSRTKEEPGSILDVTRDGGMLIACGEGTVIELYRIRIDRGATKWAAEWRKETNIRRLG